MLSPLSAIVNLSAELYQKTGFCWEKIKGFSLIALIALFRCIIICISETGLFSCPLTAKIPLQAIQENSHERTKHNNPDSRAKHRRVPRRGPSRLPPFIQGRTNLRVSRQSIKLRRAGPRVVDPCAISRVHRRAAVGVLDELVRHIRNTMQLSRKAPFHKARCRLLLDGCEVDSLHQARQMQTRGIQPDSTLALSYDSSHEISDAFLMSDSDILLLSFV